jgi:hypothetical protein
VTARKKMGNHQEPFSRGRRSIRDSKKGANRWQEPIKEETKRENNDGTRSLLRRRGFARNNIPICQLLGIPLL